MFDDDIFPTLSCPLGHGLFIMTGGCPLWICPNCGACSSFRSMMMRLVAYGLRRPAVAESPVCRNFNPAVTVH